MAAASSTAPPPRGGAREDDAAYTLSYRHVFGVKSDVRSNVHFFDETQLVYPVGHTTVLYQTDQKTQRFFPGTEGYQEITALTVSPNKR